MSRADELYEKYSTTKRFSTQNVDERNKRYKRRSDELYDKYSTTRRFESSIQYADDEEEKKENKPVIQPDTSVKPQQQTNTQTQTQTQVQAPTQTQTQTPEQNQFQQNTQVHKQSQPQVQDSSAVKNYLNGYTPTVTVQNQINGMTGYNKEAKKFDNESYKSIAKNTFDNMLKQGALTNKDYVYLTEYFGMPQDKVEIPQIKQVYSYDPLKADWRTAAPKDGGDTVNSQYIYRTPNTSRNSADDELFKQYLNDYQKQVESINQSTQDDSIKDSYLEEARLQYEINLLAQRERIEESSNKSVPKNDNSVFATPSATRNRELTLSTSQNQTKTKTQTLLEEKKKRLNTIKTQNKLNRTLENEEVSSLVGALHDDEVDKETTVLNSLLNPSYAESKAWSTAINSAMGNESTASKAYNARQKLIEMGYNPDELLEQYSRNKSRVLTEALTQSSVEFGKEHPVLGTVLSFPAMFASGAGMIETAKATLTGRDVDPNSPYFTALNVAQGLRGGASSELSSGGEVAYMIGTTIGDMVVTKLGSFGSDFGYAAVMASQAAASTAQEGAQKGYSTEHILINSLTSAALTAVCEKIGYDKVFSAQKATSSKELFGNILRGFLAEGLEEASEETLNTLTTNITSLVFNGETETLARVKELMARGMSREDAEAQAIFEIVGRVGQSYIAGGFSGGILSGVTSSKNYVANRISNLLSKKQTNDAEAPAVNTENEQKTPLNSSVVANDETVDTPKQNAATEQNTGYANEFDNLYDEDVSEEIEQPAEEVDTTVDENGTVYFDFDDDTDFEAVNEELKEEYNAEETAGLAEKIEPYTSGNSSVDALVNTNGRLDRKITINEQAQQRITDIAQRFFGRKVKFVDDIPNANGVFDPDTGEIVLSKTSSMKELTLFGHEFGHTLEGTDEYIALTDFLFGNSRYIKSELAKVNNDWDELVQKKIDDYQDSLGKTLTTSQAEYEIYADAIANELFTSYDTIERLATQNQSVFQKLKQWFVRTVFGGDTDRIYKNQSLAQLKTYALMLKAEKAAMNKASGEGVSYSARSIDTDYLNAVKSGDTERQQMLVEEAAEKAGYSYTAYHGTKDAFTVFESGHSNKYDSGYLGEGFYFTDQKNFAEDYSNWKKGNGEKKVMNVALKIDNPLVVEDSRKPHLIAVQEALGLHLTDFGNYLFTPNNEISKAITDEAKKQGYDGIIRHSDAYGETTFVVFNSNQVKSMDAVTYDDGGNVIPLSERFNSSKQDIRYSAKQSEVAQRITENFGYTETTANNIVKAARTLKKKTGSKADTDSLSYLIASAVKTKGKENSIEKDARLIATMIAESANGVNEEFVAENKPIMDYLKKKKISISEADISDLGDAFSYVQKRLFPIVTLAKEGGIPVDTFFQELSAEFPNVFDAETTTHPADQVRAIMDFIEDYRVGQYYQPYLVDNEAYLNLLEDVETLLGNDKMSDDEVLAELEKLVDKHGEIKNGVPKSIDGETKVRGTIATIMGTKAVVSDPSLQKRFAQNIIDGVYNRDVHRQGYESEKYLNSIKSSDDVAGKVESEYRRLSEKLRGYRYNDHDIVEACSLLPLLKDYLSTDDFLEFSELLGEVGTASGRNLRALRILNDLSPMQKLKVKELYVENYNKRRFGNEAEAVYSDNGMITDGSKPEQHKPGIAAMIYAKRAERHQKVKIPTILKENLKNAKTKQETDEAMNAIDQYIANKTQKNWWQRINAFRFLSMLSSPLTAIRNFVSNVSGAVTARAKDVTASGLYKLGVARSHGAGNIRTVSVKTDKASRNAAFRIMREDNSVQLLYSGQNKQTGKKTISPEKPMKTSKVMKKAGEKVPVLGLILENRTEQPTPFKSKLFKSLASGQQKLLDDTPFKIARSLSVLSQAIHINTKLGNIKNIDDFLAVALNGDTAHLNKETIETYSRLYDEFCRAAAREGDEATLREENDLINKFIKFRNGDRVWNFFANVLTEGLAPFLKTPANATKRSVEYSPLGLVWNATADNWRVSKGDINRNTYINRLAKGITGTGMFALGVGLGAMGLISAGDDDEEDEAERKLLNGQEYSKKTANGSYTLDWLTPVSIPLFMGAKLFSIAQQMKEDKESGEEVDWAETLSLANVLLDAISSVSEPMFNQTMLEGINGAFEAIGREATFSDKSSAAAGALVKYCAENWLNQFMPSIGGAIARTIDDEVRTYYTDENAKTSDSMQDFLTSVRKKTPFASKKNAAKLDMWGQPIKSGNLSERLIENFISPGYYQEETKDEATLAIMEFAEDNNIPYSDIEKDIIKEVPNYYEDYMGEKYYFTAEEYEYYAGEIGKARKEAIEKYLVDGENAEIEYTYSKTKRSLKSGKSTEKATFRGDISEATNTKGWAPTDKEGGYIEYEYDDENNKKAVKITPASDEEFRAMLLEKLIKEETDKASSEAMKTIAERRKD